MKTFKYILLIALAIIFVQCEDYMPDEPTACLESEIIDGSENGLPVYIPSMTVKLGQDVFFSACERADKLVIYTGDEGHVYGTDGDSGAYFSNKTGVRYQYTYSAVGSYTVTLVATNTSYGSTDVSTKVATTSIVINVVE